MLITNLVAHVYLANMGKSIVHVGGS